MPCQNSRNSSPTSEFRVPPSYPSEYKGTTRWQKPGPMSRNEWAIFHSRYQENAASAAKAEASEDRLSNRMSGGSVASQSTVAREEHIWRLSRPRWERSKYIPPPKEVFTYRPKTNGRPYPCPERGRPTKKPKVPCCFQHEDIEAEFWANLRFPVSRKALEALPSKKTCKLSRPREICWEPPRFEGEIYCRRKMSPRQWRCHLERLQYLSLPNFRVLAEMGPC
ncbi:uncharacterized protein LOC110188620 [Drosophila serrata]|uniref:uncharacterized protein LOC110188620 n=1 Tax=Drosophila serrata TaxID=7274 RepID=UPI000A1D31FB|nr:uncharacterized protein LOC110188620 [Drosophila serrata]